MRYTTSPLAARMLWPLLERVVFGPPPTPVPFRREIGKWRLLRPSRLGNAAAESGMLVREAGRLTPRYHEIAMPVTIMAGDCDRIVSLRRHAERLHDAIRGSDLVVVPGMGHMLHHHVPREVMRAIDRVAGRAPRAAMDDGTDRSLDQRLAPIGHA
jgi:pimeloyl-ACP methyl ester carboxylesterase